MSPDGRWVAYETNESGRFEINCGRSWRGAKFGVQVANARGARLALDLGADYIVCQGIEAGGHVQSSTRNVFLSLKFNPTKVPTTFGPLQTALKVSITAGHH